MDTQQNFTNSTADPTANFMLVQMHSYAKQALSLTVNEVMAQIALKFIESPTLTKKIDDNTALSNVKFQQIAQQLLENKKHSCFMASELSIEMFDKDYFDIDTADCFHLVYQDYILWVNKLYVTFEKHFI